MKQHWYLVAHRAGARLFSQQGIKPELQVVHRFDNPQGKLKDSELVADRQGRTDQMGQAGHIALGRDGGPHNKVTENFAHLLAKFIEAAAEKGSFDSLVLVAEPHFLGELNRALGKASVARQRPPLIKDLAHISDHDMAKQLSSVLCVREEIHPQAG